MLMFKTQLEDNKKNSILKKILIYNEEKNKYLSKIINLKIKYKIKFIDYKDYKIIELYNNNNKILVGKYYFYGIYQKINKIWIWGTSIPGLDRKNMKNINKIRGFDYLFEEDNNEKINFYYQLLTQDMLYIADIKLLKLINELLIYLSNDLHCFNPINVDGNIYFISLYKIKELFTKIN